MTDAGALVAALVDPPDQLEQLGPIGKLGTLVALRRWLDERPSHDLARLDDADLHAAASHLVLLGAGRRLVLAAPDDVVHLGVDHRLVELLDAAVADRDAHQLAPGAYAINPPSYVLENTVTRTRTVRSSPEALDAKARLVVSRPAAWPAYDPDGEPTYVGAARTVVEAGLVVAHPVTGGPVLATDVGPWSGPLGDLSGALEAALDHLGVARHDPVRAAVADFATVAVYRDDVDDATARRPVAPWSWLPHARFRGTKLVWTKTGTEERGTFGAPGSFLEALADAVTRARATLPSPPPGDLPGCWWCGASEAPAVRWTLDTHGRARCHQEACTRGQNPGLSERAGVVKRLVPWEAGTPLADQVIDGYGLHLAGGFSWWGERAPRPPATRRPFAWVDQRELNRLVRRLNDRREYNTDPNGWHARKAAEADEKARQAEIDEKIAAALAAATKETSTT